MDAGQLAELFASIAILVGLGRYVFGALDRAESGFTSLFVPPSRDLGWPRGVQESDAPWGWRPAAEPLETIDADGVADLEVVRGKPDPITRIGSYVLLPRSVAPVRFRSLPQ